ALGQRANEDTAIASARDLVILDTDLVSTYVYGCYYYGACPPWIERAARERLGDLYLLPELELPFETDHVRDTPEARIALHERFADTLHTLGARVVRLAGPVDARLAQARAAIDAVRRSR